MGRCKPRLGKTSSKNPETVFTKTRFPRNFSQAHFAVARGILGRAEDNAGAASGARLGTIGFRSWELDSETERSTTRAGVLIFVRN